MNEFDVEDLVLLALSDGISADSRDSTGATTSELGDTIGLTETMADRLTLLSAMSTLSEADLVDETVNDSGDGGERSRYRLTDAGRRRAIDRRDAVLDDRVTVHDGDETIECRMADVPDRFGLSLAEAVVRHTPAGDLYLGAGTDDGIVDRTAELARLEAAFEAAREEAPRTAIVSGDAGVGKTTLVEAFADRVREGGAAVLIGRAGRDGGEAYGPLRAAIEGEIDELDALSFADDWAEAADAEMYQAQLTALYNRMTTALAAHARETPTVLVIEDVQWADTATVDALAHVASESPDVPLMIVATYRPDGVDDEEPLGRRLAERSATDSTVELALDPFDWERTAELVEAEVQRRGVPDDFVDAIYDGTGGNPLFVVETVAQLLESGVLDPRIDRYPATIADIEIPDVVETMIDRRFARLDDETRRVLDVAAAVGDPVPVEALVAISSRTESMVRERIELLIDGGIWVRDGDDRIRFRSEVLRSTALASMADDRRQALHGRVAAYLADDEAAPSATVAAHYERAGEPERALKCYRQAAADATAVYAHDVAVDHYERALWLARELDRDETVLDLLEALGELHATRGEYEAADKQFRYVRERATAPDRIRRSYRHQARMAFESNKHDEAEAYARRGLAVGEDEITEEVCWLTDYLGSAYFGRGEYETAIKHHERLRERAESIDYSLSLGRAYQNLGTCYGSLGEMERSIELNERGVDRLESAGDERELATALNDLAVAYDRIGDYEAAADALERCDELADRTGNLMTAISAKTNRAIYAQRRGEWEAARARYAEVRDIADRIDDREARALAIWNESLIDQEIGHVGDAIDGLETALDIVRETDSTNRVAHFEWGLGTASFLAAEFERAAAHLDAALDIATDNEYTRTIGAVKSTRGSIERERGEMERAIELQREGRELVSELDGEVVRHLRANRLARTLVHAGEAEDALEIAREAHDEMPAGNPKVSVKIDATYGAAQLAAGDRDSARETLESVVERARDFSNEALVIALRELGRLETLEGDESAARERLEAGRRIAADAGLRVYGPHFDELLAALDEASPAESEEPLV